MFSWAATWTAMVTFLPTFLLEERELSLKLGGPLLAFLYYVLIPSAPVAAFLERRVRRRKLFLWVPSLFNVIFGLSIALTPNPLLLMACIAGCAGAPLRVSRHTAQGGGCDLRPGGHLLRLGICRRTFDHRVGGRADRLDSNGTDCPFIVDGCGRNLRIVLPRPASRRRAGCGGPGLTVWA